MLLSQIIRVGIMSMIPIIEQRGAIPYGLGSLQMEPWEVYLVSTIGALIPAPFIILLTRKIFSLLKKHGLINKYAQKWEKKLIQKGDKVKKYEYLGLLILVMIPFPGTGVWTGSMVAALLKLDYIKSLMTIALGAMLSGGIIFAGIYIFHITQFILN